MKTVKVTLVSNFVSLHQIEICRAFLKHNDVSFTYVSSYGPSGEKKDLGDYENESFVIRAYESVESWNNAANIINSSDMVIFGGGDRNLIKNYTGYIFYYAEHFSKDYLTYLRAVHVHSMYRNDEKSYLLCSSSRAKKDFKIAGLFKNRCLKWGYFPETVSVNDNKANDFKFLKLLWVGRDLKWKRLSYAFLAAKTLYNSNVDFKLEIVSRKNETLDKLLKKHSTKPYFNSITTYNFLSHEEIIDKMASSNLYLFTSNRKEGWGAVLNEAMASACCCIASSSAGSTNFLISNNKNGLIFKTKREFKKKLAAIAKDSERLNLISLNAKETIKEVWNAENAVNNLLLSFKSIKMGYCYKVGSNEPGVLYE